MSTQTCILVDDEQDALETLQWMLDRYCPELEIIGTYNDPLKAVEAIKKQSPTCLFLDVQMPKMSGFDLLEQFSEPAFQTIFTTAHDQFAIPAIKVSVLDYLLKPIEKEDLIAAVAKLSAIVPQKITTKERIGVGKVKILYEGNFHLFEPNELIYLKAEKNYTRIYLSDGTKILLSKTLKSVEADLPQDIFFRSHNSYLINLNHIKKISKGNDAVIELTNGNTASLSRTKKEELFNKL
ncbi:LytR/AlgR family response regulator transcription factor [Spongiivirga citrea]|uniref:Response regulator n=1 Tax=Spongiivirga citrea TaxID=1481457 RepID=A0A6M0CIS2_9FLAO|nr:LytTR family DNA-binding domain-containing protein [Spongiivirga citrea]NER15874.1 response regulator [Spongiivirga citrea]